MNINKIDKYNKRNWTTLLQPRQKNKQVQSQIKIHLKNITKILIMIEHKTDMNITKIEKYKKNLKYKVSKNKHTTNKDKKQPNRLGD